MACSVFPRAALSSAGMRIILIVGVVLALIVAWMVGSAPHTAAACLSYLPCS